MSTLHFSAGLLYVYLSGYEENGRLYVQQINSYCYIEDGLYRRIMETAKLSDEEENTVHIFAVVGPKDKANMVCSSEMKQLPSAEDCKTLLLGRWEELQSGIAPFSI